MNERQQQISDPAATGPRMTRRQFLVRGSALGLGAAALRYLPAIPAAPARAQGQVTVSIHALDGARWAIPLIALGPVFTEKNPNIKVEVTPYPWSEYLTHMGAELASDSSTFDIYLATPGVTSQFRNKLEPLDKFFEQDPDYLKDYESDIAEFYRKAYEWEGQKFAVIHDINVMMSWYRKDILDEAGLKIPETWDEMLANARALTKDTPDGKQYGWLGTAQAGLYAGFLFVAAMDSFDVKMWENDTHDALGRVSKENKSGRILLDTPAAREVLQMMVDLSQAGDPYTPSAVEEDAIAKFQNGSLAQGFLFAGQMVLQNPNLTKYAAVMHSALVPRGGKSTRHGSVMGGWSMVLNAASQHKDEAFEFMKYVASREAAPIFVANTGQPARLSTMRDLSSQQRYQVLATMAEQTVLAHPELQFPEVAQAYEIYGNKVSDAMAGRIPVDQALKDAQKGMEELFLRLGYIDQSDVTA